MQQAGRILDEAAMVRWGERLGKAIQPPRFLALRGDLGAGKSTLARAIARGAGVEGPIPSPTFNLLFRYETPRGLSIVHLDLYRLEDPEEVWDLGWSELPGDHEVVLVEWPERAEALLPPDRWEVLLEEVDRSDQRRIRITTVGDPGPMPELEGI